MPLGTEYKTYLAYADFQFVPNGTQNKRENVFFYEYYASNEAKKIKKSTFSISNEQK